MDPDPHYAPCPPHSIVKEDGVGGLFRGAGPTVVRAMSLNMGMLASNDQVGVVGSILVRLLQGRGLGAPPMRPLSHTHAHTTCQVTHSPCLPLALSS